MHRCRCWCAITTYADHTICRPRSAGTFEQPMRLVLYIVAVLELIKVTLMLWRGSSGLQIRVGVQLSVWG